MANHVRDTVVVVFTSTQQEGIEGADALLSTIPEPYRGAYERIEVIGGTAFLVLASRYPSFDENDEADLWLSRFSQHCEILKASAHITLRVKNKISILNALASTDFWGSILGLEPEMSPEGPFA